MTRALRLRLDPLPASAEGSAGLIEGLSLELTSLGTSGSKAKFEEGVPASIEFRLAVRKEVRPSPEPERTLLGTLAGRLALVGPSATPEFTIEDPATALSLEFDAEELAKAPPPAESGPGAVPNARRPRPRVLPLDFAGQSFSGTASIDPCRLVIPADKLEGFRFFDIEAKLSLAAATEADFDVNDVLDGRITADSPPPLPTFDILVIDDVGKPLDGVALRIEHGGKGDVVTTDDTGFVRLIADQPEQGSVEFDDVAALKTRLKPEWDKADRGKNGSPPVTDETRVFPLHGPESPSAEVDTEEPRILRVQPYVFLARLTGMFFDLNKTFLLPTAMPGLKEARALYERHDPGKLLIIGHTDTSGSPSTNDPLSLERARSVAAYLSDDVGTWEKQYGSGVQESRRWGKHEDEQMAGALPTFPTTRLPGEAPIPWFQRTRGFPSGPTLDAAGRKQVIREYMDLDGADVTELGLQIELVNHGCGENFPLDDTGQELDPDATDGERAQLDRRVELFFFDDELGVQPKAADGSNSKKASREYPEWRRRAVELREISAQGGARDRHVSVILLSNSGNQPLGDRDVELTVEGEPPFQGKTDKDGFFEKTGLPAGDHLLKVDGVEVFVSATPTDIVQRPHVVFGHELDTEASESS